MRPRRSVGLLGLAALALAVTSVAVVPRLDHGQAVAPSAQPIAVPSPSRPSGPATQPHRELVHPFYIPAQPLSVPGPSEGQGAVLTPDSVQSPAPAPRTTAPHAVIRPA